MCRKISYLYSVLISFINIINKQKNIVLQKKAIKIEYVFINHVNLMESSTLVKMHPSSLMEAFSST